LFISLVCQSLLKFTQTLNLLWQNRTVDFNTGNVIRPIPKQAADRGFTLNGTLRLSHGLTRELIEKLPVGDVDERTSISITSLQKLLQLELTTLENRVEQAKSAQFQKYPGVSWPLKFKKKEMNGTFTAEDNFAQFNPIHDIPRTIPSLAESADGVARAVNRISTAGVFSREFDAVLRRVPGAGGAGAGGAATGGPGAGGAGAGGTGADEPAAETGPRT
jgi:hypothetical protein